MKSENEMINKNKFPQKMWVFITEDPLLYQATPLDFPAIIADNHDRALYCLDTAYFDVNEQMLEALKIMVQYYDPGIPRDESHVINKAQQAIAAAEAAKENK
jgi:hypothetical protein